MKKALKLILIFILVIPLFAFKPKEEKISLQLLWKYQFEFAGFIAAKEKGFYKDVGLDVDLKEYNFNNIIDDVEKGKSTYGITDSNLIKEYLSGKKVVILANYFKKPALVLATKQNIVLPRDLIGKKVKLSSNDIYASDIGEMFKRFNIKLSDMHIIKHDFKTDDFIAGKIDAMSVYLTNEPYEFQKHKIPYNIIDPSNYGIINYGACLFTSKKELKLHPLRVAKFIQASNRGWKYALKHKDEIINIIYNKYSKAKSKDALKFEANEIQNLMMTNVYPIGSFDKNKFKSIAEEYVQLGYIKKDYNIDGLLYTIPSQKLNLTAKEQAFLNAHHTIRVHNETNWAPYNFNKDGKPMGFSIDYFNILAQKLNIKVEYVTHHTWKEFINMIKHDQIDIMLNIVKTPKRETFLNFTQPYSKVVASIFTNLENIKTLHDLEGKKVSIPKGFYYQEYIKKKYPKIKLQLYKNSFEAIASVAFGKSDAYLGAYSVSHYIMIEKGINTIKYQIPIVDKAFNGELRIGVRKDWKILRDILQKAMNDIDKTELTKLNNKWFSQKKQNLQKIVTDIESSYLNTFIKAILVFSAILFFIWYWYQKEVHKNKELQKSNQRFEKLLNATIEAVAIFENGRCVQVNETAVKLFRYNSIDEVKGKHISKFVAPESIELSMKMWENTTKPYEAVMLRKDGTTFPALVQGTNMHEDGKDIRISAVIDMTEIKDKEFMLAQNSKMAAMGEMIGNIAHQWRQPLSAISSLASSAVLEIQLGLLSQENSIKNYKQIIDFTSYLSNTIEDFREFLKNDKKVTEFNIIDIIKKDIAIISIVYKDCDIELELQQMQDITTYGLPNELSQGILNILNNAKDAIVQNKPQKRVVILNVIQENKNIKISIQDSAGGIPDKIMPKIFEPYFTTKHKSQGTGIGLYMTRDIIVKHLDGDIQVSNKEFIYKNTKLKGANFCITIPIVKTPTLT